MKIYFVAQSDLDILEKEKTEYDISKISKKEIFNIAQIISKIDSHSIIKIYTGTTNKLKNSATEIAFILDEMKVSNDYEVYIDSSLDLNYKFSCSNKDGYIRASHVIPFLLNKYGLSKFIKLGTRSIYAENIYEMLTDILKQENKDSVVIISASAEVFRIMQKDRKIRKLCYFGDEDFMVGGFVSKSSKEIRPGDLKTIEIEMPREIGYDCKIETIAERRLNELQKQKD